MKVAHDETEKWLGIQRWNPKPRIPKINKHYYIGNRILFSIREDDDVLYFGIEFNDSYPKTPARFFSDWGGQCKSKFYCYLAERMKNESCINISCILGTVADLFLYFKDLLDKKDKVEKLLDDPDAMYQEDIEYLSDNEAEQLDEIDDTKLVDKISYLQGKVLQMGMTKYGQYNLDIEDDIWYLFASGVKYQIDSKTFKIRVISPYLKHRSILSSGLVVIKGISPFKRKELAVYNLIPSLLEIATQAEEINGEYDFEMVDTQYEMLKDHPLEVLKTSMYQVETATNNFRTYSCDVPEVLFKQIIEINSITALELTTDTGIRTYCSVGNPNPYNDKIMIPKEVSEVLKNPGHVRVRLVKPKTLESITFKDITPGFFDNPQHDNLIREELIRYPVITLGQYLTVSDYKVVIKEIIPMPCAATVLYTPGVVEAKVVYEKTDERDPLAVPQYSYESESSLTGPSF